MLLTVVWHVVWERAQLSLYNVHFSRNFGVRHVYTCTVRLRGQHDSWKHIMCTPESVKLQPSSVAISTKS